MNIVSINVRALVSHEDWKIVKQASDSVGVKSSILDDESAASDIIAIPTDLVVLDPDRMSETDWCGLCKWFCDYPHFDGYFFLTDSSSHTAALLKNANY